MSFFARTVHHNSRTVVIRKMTRIKKGVHYSPSYHYISQFFALLQIELCGQNSWKENTGILSGHVYISGKSFSADDLACVWVCARVCVCVCVCVMK